MAPSSLSVPSTSAAGPGAAYDATGLWHFSSSDSHGNTDDPFDSFVTQDANGNLTFLDDDGTPITLERLGTGAVITYRLSHAGPEDGTECDVLLRGTARLDTATNTITANITLRELGCSHQVLAGLTVTGTKLN